MVTKAELQVELRGLMRGGPGRLPISSMKKHELEAHIDAVRDMKGKATRYVGAEKREQVLQKATAFAEQIGPASPGPSGPRQIPVEDQALDEDDEEEVIKVPGQPPAKLRKAPLVNKPRESKAPVPKKSPAPKKEPKAVTVEEPTSGKSSKVSYYPAGCPTCGKH